MTIYAIQNKALALALSLALEWCKTEPINSTSVASNHNVENKAIKSQGETRCGSH